MYRSREKSKSAHRGPVPRTHEDPGTRRHCGGTCHGVELVAEFPYFAGMDQPRRFLGFRGCLREPRERSWVPFPVAVRATLRSRACCAVPPSTAVAVDLVRVRWRMAGLCRFSFHHILSATAIAAHLIRRPACRPDGCVFPLGPLAQPPELARNASARQRYERRTKRHRTRMIGSRPSLHS